MKVSGIIITLTFLCASNSIGGASAIGDAPQNGFCSFVKSFKACSPKSFKCSYETLKTENDKLGMYHA
ncbi:predicted protein [Lichtheimia corymbifera JMRC:FSU:9682]|uniref:Uncharacterized protein n=1 Tax=Lichtheimia corymbifera JMRC:FSU:9682 TaxID=1263082 RepID=A0A068SD77_9FUNG|nr:predicted protein [Lichtheimia corymbifera JMRC:FSU:9682]